MKIYIPSLILLAVAVGYVAIAAGYNVEAKAMPLLVGGSLIVLLALDLAALTPTRIGQTLTATLNPDRDAPVAAYPIGRQAAALSWVAAFVALTILFGVLIGTLAYVGIWQYRAAKRSWIASAAIAAIVAAFIWLLFTQLLRIPLYPGVIFEV